MASAREPNVGNNKGNGRKAFPFPRITIFPFYRFSIYQFPILPFPHLLFPFLPFPFLPFPLLPINKNMYTLHVDYWHFVSICSRLATTDNNYDAAYMKHWDSIA